MGKFEPQVGQEFPLDEGRPRDGHDRHHYGHHRWRHHHHHHRRHFGHRHHRHGLAGLAFLLVAGGIAALIINHQFTAAMATNMIWAGAGLAVLSLVARALLFAAHMIWHWRQHQRADRQVA